MILLSSDVTSQWSFLASPPTHALLLERIVGVDNVVATYQYGNLDGSGNFVENEFTNLYRDPATNIGWVRATAQLQYGISGTIDAALHNLLDAGVAPSPADPTVAITVPSKHAGEAKIADFDAVMARCTEELAGTVV